MEAKKFSKKEAIKFGWQKMKANFWFFISLFAITFLVSLGSQLAMKETSALSVLFFLVFYFLLTLISMGLIKIVLKLHDNEKAEIADLFSSYPLFFKYFFGSILCFLIVFIGLLFFIVPGIIFAIKFFFFDYFIIDKKIGPIEALKKSSEITKGTKWNLFLFFLLITMINILGAICFLVGLFFTVPTTMMAMAFVYRKLAEEKENNQAIEELKAA